MLSSFSNWKAYHAIIIEIKDNNWGYHAIILEIKVEQTKITQEVLQQLFSFRVISEAPNQN